MRPRRPLQYPLVRLATIKLRADQPLRRKLLVHESKEEAAMASIAPARSANT